MEWQERGPDKLGYSERDFKVCGLCGALNPAANAECFVCNWSGMFHTDRETVVAAMRTLEQDHGGLSESLFVQETVPSTPPRPSLWSGLWGSVRRIFSRA